MWYYLKANQWLFVLNSPSRITIDCRDDTQFQQQLPHTGILRLPAECIATTREYVFYPHSDILSGQPTNIHPLQRFNYTEHLDQPAGFQPIVIPKLRSFNPDHIKQIYAAQQEELNAFNKGFVEHSWTGYLTVTNAIVTTLIFCGIAYAYRKLKGQRNARSTSSTYQPPAVLFHVDRSSSSTPTIPKPKPIASITEYLDEEPRQKPRRSRRLNPHMSDDDH